MYSAGPPDAGDTTPLRITGIARRRFPAPAELTQEHAALLTAYLTDLMRPYGRALTGPVGGQSYAHMAGAVMAPVDLVVLAFAVPDVDPGRATATYLSHLAPGVRLAFAICDQGSAAPFTALRLIDGYLRTGECGRALLVVAEQADLPYSPTRPVTLPTGPAVVAVACGASGGTARVAALNQHPGLVDPHPVLAREVTALSPAHIIVSASLAGVDHATVAPAGQPSTGVWWALADAVDAAPAGRVLIADYDPALRYLCVSAIDVDQR